MPARLLHALTATVGTPGEAAQALRAMRRAAASLPEGGALLLFCDLPARDAPHDPDDALAVRALQSGAMAAEARAPGTSLLLVRARVWDDAARAYLGAERPETPASVLAALMTAGECAASFEAASVSPASLAGRFDALLVHDASLYCLPGAPARMLEEAERAGAACASADVLPPADRFRSPLDRLLRMGFSLSSARAAADARLAPSGYRAAPGEAALYLPEALRALAAGEKLPPALRLCSGFFVRGAPATVSSLLRDARREAAAAFARAGKGASAHDRLGALPALLPAAQLALLFASALTGLPPLCAAAVFLPEYPALSRPRMLPGALVRTALLPASAACALDALAERATARSPLLRLSVPEGARGARGCALCGGALLTAALLGAGALAPLLPVSLLWLSGPLLFPALSAPERERLPLREAERARLLALAAEAFPRAEASPSAARRLLAACAGCQLGLLEPDEAARRAEALLDTCFSPLSPDEAAALLCAAQLLRERMADCDAALRALPAAVERAALDARVREEGPLGALLCAALDDRARGEAPDAEALRPVRAGADFGEGDALFLPAPFLGALPPRASTLPLTHPHAFLRGARLPAPDGAPDPALLFLSLACAARGETLSAALFRSPVAGPYAAAFGCY